MYYVKSLETGIVLVDVDVENCTAHKVESNIENQTEAATVR